MKQRTRVTRKLEEAKKVSSRIRQFRHCTLKVYTVGTSDQKSLRDEFTHIERMAKKGHYPRSGYLVVDANNLNMFMHCSEAEMLAEQESGQSVGMILAESVRRNRRKSRKK